MSETISIREGEDFDLEAAERYLRAHVEDVPEGELEVSQFPSGASNLTYLLKVGDWEGVLRRPPLGPVPPKAHDMGRESGILARLNDVFPDGVEHDEELCRGISRTLVDTLVDLHAVDFREAGLRDLGKPDGFLRRQTEGWISRYEKAKSDEIEEVGPLTDWLARDIPKSPPPAVIHNDYKLNNLVLDPVDLKGVRAVLDWEMATVGDPLFDLAVSLSYWIEPGDPDELSAVMPTVTVTPGFMTRKELIDRYESESGRDLSEMHWYVVFGYFKLAGILQQIYARYKNGQTTDERFATFGDRVRTLILHAENLSRTGDV